MTSDTVSVDVDPAARAQVKELVHDHWQWLYRVARNSHRSYPMQDFDDIYADAVLGMFTAATRYDPAMGVPFRGYAGSRINGAILDGVRARDHRTRAFYEDLRTYDTFRVTFMTEHRRDPTVDDICTHLGWTVQRYREFTNNRRATFLSLDANTARDDFGQNLSDTLIADHDVHADVAVNETQQELLDAIEMHLEDTEAFVIHTLFFDDCKARDVAAMLGVGEARVSQIRRSALRKLRDTIHRLSPDTDPVTCHLQVSDPRVVDLRDNVVSVTQ